MPIDSIDVQLSWATTDTYAVIGKWWNVHVSLSGSFGGRRKSKDEMGSWRLLSQVPKGIINQAKGKVKGSIHLTSIGWCLQASRERTSTIQLHRIITSIYKLSISCNLKLSASASCSQSSVAGSASRPSASRTARTGFSICRFLPWLFHERKGHNMGVSQNEAAGTGSLSQGFVSRVCFVVCFGGLFRTVLLPRTVKFTGSVSGSVSKVCFGVCFGGLFRQSRTSQPYLKLHSSKKYKPILSYNIIQYPQSLQSLRSPSSKILPCCYYSILQSLEF